MKENVRLVSINGIDVTITSLDFDYPNYSDNIVHSKFNITFNATVNSQLFVLNFNNQIASNQNQSFGDVFIGTGDSYSQFLMELETNPQLQDTKQYSDDTKNAANEVIGAIAQSVYMHVQSHSPDQDEE